MAIQNENNSSELIDVKAETAKNAAAIADVLKSDPSASSFFGGSSGPSGSDTEYGGTSPSGGGTSQSSTLDPFLASGWGGGKKAEIVKNVAGIAFDSGSNGTNSNFFGKGKQGTGDGFHIKNASERGPAQPAAKPQVTHIVKPNYRDALKMGKPSAKDSNHHFVGSVRLAGNAVSGTSYGHGGKTFTPSITTPTPEMVQQLSHVCHTLRADQNTLHQIQNGPLSRNRLIADAQDGKEGAKQQLRTMSAGQRVEAFRNMSPSIKQDIKDGPGT